MSSAMIRVAFIDVDRTIFSINSGNMLVWKAYTHKLMGLRQLVIAGWYALLYRTRIGKASEIIDKMALWTEGVRESDLNSLCAEMFDTYLKKKIRPEMIEEVKRLKNNGVRIVILSAALSAICRPTADALGIEEILSSELEVIDGKFTGYPKGKINYAGEKLVRVIDYCKNNNVALNEVSCYTDSYSDIPVLEAVLEAICISPDKRLRKQAKRRGWKVLDW